MPGSVIVGGARTPIGKLSGALKGFTAMDLPALTVNKVCLSGLNAIAMADQLINVGEFDVVVAGGMESMTNGPYLLPGARGGYRYGDSKIVDATAHDALYCAFDLRGMGDSTEFYSKQKQLTREDQDAYSAQSHERAVTARKNGLFDDEIVTHGNVAGPDASLLSQPANAILKALGREGRTAAEVDLFEINEAFAAVALQSMRDLDISDKNVNVNGGAISMGHPVGASGARVALHLALELGRRGGGLGAAGLCGGGGQGEALVLRVTS